MPFANLCYRFAVTSSQKIKKITKLEQYREPRSAASVCVNLRSSAVRLYFLCAFASLREIFLFLTHYMLATPSARQRLGPIARLSGVPPALSPPGSGNCLFVEATMLALHPGSSN